MEQVIEGRAYVLGNDIDTDQIIPAEHLVYSLSDPEERKNYGKYALSSVPSEGAGLPDGGIKFVEDGKYESEYSIIVGGDNFGCGSSREHAPAAMEIAGIKAVVAASYARIFYRNSVDGGFFVPFESASLLTNEIKTGDTVVIDVKNCKLTNKTRDKSYDLKPLGEIMDILEAGNIFEYAKKAGLMKTS